MKTKITLVVMLCLIHLTGCSTYTEKKAPCDYQGTFCGNKISINQ